MTVEMIKKILINVSKQILNSENRNEKEQNLIREDHSKTASLIDILLLDNKRPL